MALRRILLVLIAAGVVPLAPAAMLYKSIGPNGVVEFSDTPPAGGKVVEQRELGSAIGTLPGMPASSAPVSPRAAAMENLANDPEVANAADQVDLAEHALALARRGTWSPMDGLKLRGLVRTSSDEERIEYYKRGVVLARQNLLNVMKRRAVVLSEPGMPFVTASISR
jgi:uncharacterized protein DUF4124